jgi:hypothetical protein
MGIGPWSNLRALDSGQKAPDSPDRYILRHCIQVPGSTAIAYPHYPMNTAHVRALALATAAALLGGLTACSNSTAMESSWKAPEVGSIHFTKILVVGIAPVDSLRQPVEDAMKAQITGIPVVASYEVLPHVADQVDPKKITAVIKTGGFDGIIALRMVSLDDKTTYHPGGEVPVPYYSFYSYYSPSYALSPYYRGVGGYMGPVTYEYVPPSVTQDLFVSIETSIYDGKTGKLVWVGQTRTTNPDDLETLIAKVAASVRSELRHQELIP